MRLGFNTMPLKHMVDGLRLEYLGQGSSPLVQSPSD